MTRDDGFQTADISTVLLDDPKIRKLARRCPDDGELAAAVVVYMATLLASWREGRRLTATEAEGWVEPNPERMGYLQEVGLLDAAGRVPSAAWERHFRPAWERREGTRRGGRVGAGRRWGTDGVPITEASGGDGVVVPVRPPTDRPTGSLSTHRVPIDEKPYVLLTDDEKAAQRKRDQDELLAKTAARLGVRP